MNTRLLIRSVGSISVLVVYGSLSADSSLASTGAAVSHHALRSSAVSTLGARASDIPDNQVFLGFRDKAAGYVVSFPEGWLQHQSATDVTFRDKDNRMELVASGGSAFSSASVRADIASLKTRMPGFHETAVSRVSLPAGEAFKVTYSTLSPSDPVTGKRVALTVDRYYFARAGRRVILELASAKGADNVDAYLLIARSFRWR